MGQVSASSTVLINAEPDAVLAAVADYQTVRPKILSSHYSGYQVLEGGQGAGTVATWKLQATKSRVRDVKASRRRRGPHRHREGRQLDDGDQLDRRPRRNRVDRHREDRHGRAQGGIGGFFEKTFAPLGLRKIQAEVLENLKTHVEAGLGRSLRPRTQESGDAPHHGVGVLLPPFR